MKTLEERMEELKILRTDLNNSIAFMENCEGMLSHDEKNVLEVLRRCREMMKRIKPLVEADANENNR